MMRLPPAIPQLSVEKRVSPKARHTGQITVLLTKGASSTRRPSWSLPRLARTHATMSSALYQEIRRELERGSDGLQWNQLASCYVSHIIYQGYTIACWHRAHLSTISSICGVSEASTALVILSLASVAYLEWFKTGYLAPRVPVQWVIWSVILLRNREKVNSIELIAEIVTTSQIAKQTLDSHESLILGSVS